VGPEYLGRIARGSAVGGIGIALAFVVCGRFRWGLGVAAGDLWAIANLYVVRYVVARLLRPAAERERAGGTLALILGLTLKFPLLYGAGYLMLTSLVPHRGLVRSWCWGGLQDALRLRRAAAGSDAMN
jgi:hypothetical protein